ncbi:MAG: zinc-binding alcohol dehydrogenase family protein [Verrucomicrobia bacterium]|nr:zinc-binding alcohol dehydrogenase family protein [Verrucomicrobiota bacterium]
MRALWFEKTGSLENLKVRDLPNPKPRDGEVLVEVKAAALNRSDVKNVLGAMRETTTPRIPGRDFAGILRDRTGTFNAGDEVFGTGGDLGFTRDGSHAELIAVPLAAVQPKPITLSFEEAACIGIPYLVAWRAVAEIAALGEGETILITGATGAVGDAAARIAKKVCRARVIGTVRTHTDLVRMALIEYFDGWVDLGSGLLPEQVRAQTGDRGVDVVLDVVGGPLFEPCLQTLAFGGRQVAIASGSEPRVSFNLVDFYHNESCLRGVDSVNISAAEAGRIFDKLLPYFDSGDFVPPKDAIPVGFEKVLDAYREINEGKASGKYVFVPR